MTDIQTTETAAAVKARQAVVSTWLDAIPDETLLIVTTKHTPFGSFLFGSFLVGAQIVKEES